MKKCKICQKEIENNVEVISLHYEKINCCKNCIKEKEIFYCSSCKKHYDSFVFKAIYTAGRFYCEKCYNKLKI